MRKLIFIALVLILFYTRFVNLGWGLPYPMHPDERNMAVAVQRLSCPNDIRANTGVHPYQLLTTNYDLKECLNPHFFAYGQLPLYLAYGGIELTHLFTATITPPTFIEATLALRTISALASILLVLVLMKIVNLILKKNKLYKLYNFTNFITLIFFIFQPYAIQLSHFGTTESLLMLFYSLIIYYSLKLLHPTTYPLQPIMLLGLFSGLALGTKISTLLFLGVPMLAMCFKMFVHIFAIGGTIEGAQKARTKFAPNQAIEALANFLGSVNRDGICRKTLNLLVMVMTYISISLFFFILSSPHNFLNWTEFIGSMNYESGVGLGTYLPFYTRQFTNTIPVLFQFEKILPYVLGWPTLLAGVLGFFLLPSYFWNIVKEIIFHCIFQVARLKGPKKHAQSSRQTRLSKLWRTFWEESIVTESEKSIYIMFDILRFALLISFLPSSFFFAKWTRFIAPSFPLFSLFAILFFIKIFQKVSSYPSASSGRDRFQVLKYTAITLLILPGLAYLSIYASPDIRFTASEWIYKNVPANSKILSETANVIDLPVPTTNNLQPITYLINSFNFYDLDMNPQLQSDLANAIQEADYIIVPSRRIFKNHNSPNYQLLTTYYSDLFSGKSGFEKVAEFSSFPNLSFQLSLRQAQGKTPFSFQLPFPDENAEETWTVFDHPVIRIYKRSQKTEDKSKKQKQNNLDFSQYRTTNYQLLTTTYKLLIADTPAKWEKGLMYVKNKEDIGGMDGMIFTFPDSAARDFWNKNTLSPLTLYWINNKKVLGISEMPSLTESGIIQTLSSPAPADTVIEIIKVDSPA